MSFNIFYCVLLKKNFHTNFETKIAYCKNASNSSEIESFPFNVSYACFFFVNFNFISIVRETLPMKPPPVPPKVR